MAPSDDPLLISLPGGLEISFRHLPPGSFMMGSRGYDSDEEPRHRVTITGAFYLGATPVTQEQFAVWRDAPAYGKWLEGNRAPVRHHSSQEVIFAHGNHFAGQATHPVDSVTWWEARAYAEWLTESKRLPPGWRAELPTEAQWEYACRGRTETEYWSGDGEQALDEVGWFGGNSGETTHAVGRKARNLFGLSDVHGNVAEWCLDYCDPALYRRRADPSEGTAVTNPSMVAAEEVNPIHEDLAETLKRFADGKGVVQARDGPRLEALQHLAEERALSDQQWEPVVGAARHALGHGQWPEEASQMAGGLFETFHRLATIGSGNLERVLRGGGFLNAAVACRSAYRDRYAPGNRVRDVGFRLALIPHPEK